MRSILFFAEEDLLLCMETTVQCYLWLYRCAVVKGIQTVSPSYMYTQRSIYVWSKNLKYSKEFSYHS